MKSNLNKLKSSTCRNVLISSLCFLAMSNPAFSQEKSSLGKLDFNQNIIKATSNKSQDEITKMLKGVKINSTSSQNGSTLLMEAAKSGNENLVRSLINQGADVNIKDLKGRPALKYAMDGKNYDIAKFLVDSGAQTKFLGTQETAFRKFISEYSSEKLATNPPAGYKELYASNSTTQDFGDELVNAADKGDLAKIKELVAAGHSVNSTGMFSTTALMRASYHGNDEIVNYLVKNGAKINMADDAGMTSLSLAQLGGVASTQKILAANGATAGLYSTVEPAAGPLVFAAPVLSAIPGGALTAILGGTAAAGAGIAIASSGGSSSSSSSGGTGGTGGGTGGDSGGDSGGNSGGGTTTSTFTTAEKNSTGSGVTVAVIGNGVYNSGTYTDGSHAGSATSTGAGSNSSSAYNFTTANSNGVVVWDSNSTDFVGDGTDGTPVGSATMNGHDTETALIINQIASDSKILSVRAFNGLGQLDAQELIDGIAYASAKGAKVINNSWGLRYSMTGLDPSDNNNFFADPTFIAQSFLSTFDGNGDVSGSVVTSIKTAIDAGNVMVWAAGNDGLSNPNITAGLYLIDPNLDQNATGTTLTANADVAKYWLVAGAVQDNGNGSYSISATGSNQCGLTQARCLVAVANSTSHAAAEVSGAVAKLIASGLTTDQAAARVLATAYYLDANGHTVSSDGVTEVTIASGNAAISSAITLTTTDANGFSNTVTGHGVLNPDLATSAYGSLFVTTGDGTSALLSGSSIKLSKAFGDALTNSGITLHAFDNGGAVNSEFGSAKFAIPLANLISNDNSKLDLDEAMGRIGNSQFANTVEFGNGKLEFTPYSSDTTKGQIISPEDNGKAMTGNFAYTTNISGSSYEISHNVKMSKLFGFGAITAPDYSTSISDASQKNPYLGFAEEGFSSVMKNDLTKNLSLKLGAFNGTEKNMYDDVTYQGKDVSGTVGELTYSFNNTSLGVQAGSIIEKGAFLGSETTGVFATDGGTPTNFIGFSAQNKLTDHLNVFGYYVTGNSTPAAGPGSLFSGGISDITSSAYSIGISYDGFEDHDKSVGFSVAQPLRIDSGTASFAYGSGSGTLNLAPTGREMDVESYYHIKLGANSSTTISSMYRTNPDNISDNKDEAIALFKFQNTF